MTLLTLKKKYSTKLSAWVLKKLERSIDSSWLPLLKPTALTFVLPTQSSEAFCLKKSSKLLKVNVDLYRSNWTRNELACLQQWTELWKHRQVIDSEGKNILINSCQMIELYEFDWYNPKFELWLKISISTKIRNYFRSLCNLK